MYFFEKSSILWNMLHAEHFAKNQVFHKLPVRFTKYVSRFTRETRFLARFTRFAPVFWCPCHVHFNLGAHEQLNKTGSLLNVFCFCICVRCLSQECVFSTFPCILDKCTKIRFTPKCLTLTSLTDAWNVHVSCVSRLGNAWNAFWQPWKK